MQSSIIVLNAEAVFKESDWIGVNKKYQDVPPEVSDARNAVLQVPELQSKRLFPSYELPVTKFLEFKLPKNMKSITGTKTKVWFSADAPHTDTECLRTRPVPQEKLIQQLLNNFGQAWLDGAKSVVDPRFNNGCNRLPLWTILAWKRMVVLIKEQEKWSMSYQWLEKQRSQGKQGSETRRVVDEAIMALSTLPWKVEMKHCHRNTDTLCLSTLLGNGWLSDDHINMMMEEFSQEVESNPAMKATIIIASLGLAGEIRKNSKTGMYGRKEAPLLRRYEKHIKEKGIEKLVFPVHVNDNHWIAAFVDFKAGKIGYGES